MILLCRQLPLIVCDHDLHIGRSASSDLQKSASPRQVIDLSSVVNRALGGAIGKGRCRSFLPIPEEHVQPRSTMSPLINSDSNNEFDG
jgi:hypothetical protein